MSAGPGLGSGEAGTKRAIGLAVRTSPVHSGSSAFCLMSGPALTEKARTRLSLVIEPGWAFPVPTCDRPGCKVQEPKDLGTRVELSASG